MAGRLARGGSASASAHGGLGALGLLGALRLGDGGRVGRSRVRSRGVTGWNVSQGSFGNDIKLENSRLDNGARAVSDGQGGGLGDGQGLAGGNGDGGGLRANGGELGDDLGGGVALLRGGDGGVLDGSTADRGDAGDDGRGARGVDSSTSRDDGGGGSGNDGSGETHVDYCCVVGEDRFVDIKSG